MNKVDWFFMMWFFPLMLLVTGYVCWTITFVTGIGVQVIIMIFGMVISIGFSWASWLLRNAGPLGHD